MDDNLLQPQPLGDVLAGIKQERAQDKVAEQEITQVVVTPAWQAVLDQLDVKSSPVALIERIREFVYDGTKSNAQVGEQVRIAFMATDDLKNTITQVTETVKAHEK